MLEWRLRDRVLRIERRPLVMGIINVTPDSFSDGGAFDTSDSAVDQGLKLIEQGADFLDIGGESTRPGSEPVPAEEELRRVLPVVKALRERSGIILSVDTSKAVVAKECLAVGAHIINDVTALRDPEMPRVIRESGAGVVLMHMQGTPQTMQQQPTYQDVVRDIGQFFDERLRVCVNWGIPLESTALDPGIGFGKTSQHNLQLLARLEEFGRLGRPVCLGVSRKGFIGRLLNNRPPRQRLAGSLAAVCFAMARHAVHIVRVHDVEETKDAIAVFAAVEEQL